VELSVVSSKDIEYKVYTLGDVGVIELLLLYRYKYDENLFLDANVPSMVVSGTGRVNEEVIVTYATLDEYIRLCEFSDLQTKMIKLIGEGFSYEEIAEILKLRLSTISGRLKTIYKRIVKENDWQWKKCVYLNELGLRSKRCSKCEKELPGTVEFYYVKEDTEDGFHNFCKKCF
jgi:DNA-binding NarL/FixJ family response regulator